MRILLTDNYGMSGEAPGRDERVLLWPMSEKACQEIAKILNEENGMEGSNFYEVVPDGYKPLVWEPDNVGQPVLDDMGHYMQACSRLRNELTEARSVLMAAYQCISAYHQK